MAGLKEALSLGVLAPIAQSGKHRVIDVTAEFVETTDLDEWSTFANVAGVVAGKGGKPGH